MYYTYIVQCSDTTYYCGYTDDLKKRIESHNTLNTGAKYTRSRRPVKLVYSESFETKNEAMKREANIKKMTRLEKHNLIHNLDSK